MVLTRDDIQQIREVVIEGFETLAVPRFDTLEKDVSELKQDVSVLKHDVTVLKQDVIELKTSVSNLNDKFDNLEGQVRGLEKDTREIYMMLAKREAGAPSFNKRNLEQKIRTTYERLQVIAKEAGIVLPAE